MWNLKRPFRRHSGGPIQDDAHKDARVLLVTADDRYRGHWQTIFAARGWQLGCTGTLLQAIDTLLTQPYPVVVYDCRPGSEEWREVLNTLSEAPAAPCVLLASSVIDENFRDDVVRLHGYDVVSRNADEDEIVRTVNSAWLWKHRHA